MSVLVYSLKQASCWRSLHYQHWKYENGAPWVIGWWQRSQKFEVRETVEELKRHQVGAPLSRPSVRFESHLMRVDKQASQWPSSRPLWHRKDSQADSQKVLLANTTMRCWGLYQRVWRLLGFKDSLPQVLRRSSIIACSNALLEGPVNGLYYKPPNLSQLARWQLRHDISHCWPAYKNGILQASQGHNWYTRSSKSDHQCGCMSLRSSGINYHGSKLAIYIKVLVFAMLLSRYQNKAIYYLPPSNKRLDQETA